MLWLRLFLPFAGAYFLSYPYRTANAVVGPVLSAELSLGAASLVAELRDGVVREYEVHPEDFGIGMSASSLLVVLNSLRIQRQETD